MALAVSAGLADLDLRYTRPAQHQGVDGFQIQIIFFAPLFDELLRDMNKSGLCVGIKTLDPNINNDLLANGIKYKKCPIAILKAGNPEDMTRVSKAIDSGIVTNSGLHNFLRIFALCDKTRHIIKSNAMICVIGTVLSLAAAGFMLFVGDTSNIPSVYTVLFQLVWVLPVWLLSMIL